MQFKVIEAVMQVTGQMPIWKPMHVLSYAEEDEPYHIVAAFSDINDLNMVLRSVPHTRRQYYRITHKEVLFLS